MTSENTAPSRPGTVSYNSIEHPPTDDDKLPPKVIPAGDAVLFDRAHFRPVPGPANEETPRENSSS